jgi:hypothetical protein
MLCWLGIRGKTSRKATAARIRSVTAAFTKSF